MSYIARTNVKIMYNKQQKKRIADINTVNEAICVYARKIDKTSSVSKTTTEDIAYTNFFDNKMLISKTIREGLPYRIFNQIKNVTPFSEDDWAEYLNVSKKTLQRYKNNADYLFKPIHTEKIIELAEVTIFGEEVFDTVEQFYLWLNTPSFALDNLKPAELLKDSYGKDLVMAELNRIDQGIFI